MLIYKITNKINGKLYIGLTTTNLIKRWNSHLSVAECGNQRSVIHSAIQKHGKENFTIEQIDSAASDSDLSKKEIFWIKELNTLCPNGYNINSGGTSGWKATPESIEKNRQSHLGKKLSKSLIEKIKERTLGEKNPFYGKKHDNETKFSMSASHTGVKLSESHSEAIRKGQVEFSKTEAGKARMLKMTEARTESKSLIFKVISPLGEIISGKNLSKFCRDNELNQAHMWSVLNGQRKTHKGWSKYKNEDNPNILSNGE